MLEGCEEEDKEAITEERGQTALEKNFELENKLEPERKVKLAQELGFQPRQNRRARWKTKEPEKDYGVLKTQYDSLRNNFDSLFRDNESLLQEISKLKSKLNGEEEEEEENNAVMMESELSVKEEEVLLPRGKRVTRHCAGASYRTTAEAELKHCLSLERPSAWSPTWQPVSFSKVSHEHRVALSNVVGLPPTPFLRNLRGVTEQMWVRIVCGVSLNLGIGGDSGAAVPYDSSGALVARRLRQWFSLLEGDGDAVEDSAS
ncbi:hypothetical protein HID58_034227 [Brassica napus]|uniref:Homeobox-leucine zipper protein n=1 Tax=Brassica napus TaxID=3708 RepID=A0ABQ8C1G0_BRANA|nr:hypothetical protein HID58_034227 [Brassica napus]